MKPVRGLDASILATAVLAAAVFTVAVLAITSIAVRAASPTRSGGGVLELLQSGEGWTGFALEVETHSGELFPGGKARYLVGYENLGVVTETVRITNTLPSGGEFVGAWWGDQPNGGEPLPPPVVATGTVVAWQLPDVGGGERRWFLVEVGLGGSLNPGQSLIDLVEIAPASDETTVEDNIADTTAVLNWTGPNLAVATSSEWQLPETDRLLYETRYWNWGNGVSTGVVITYTLPAGTVLEGWWADDQDVTCPPAATAVVECEVPVLEPGATGRIWLDVMLEQPPQPLQHYTSTAVITTPQGDVVPADNGDEDVAFSGGEVQGVVVTVATEHSSMWVFAPLVEATRWITVTAPVGQFTAHPNPACGCAEFPDIGAVLPGDPVTVEAGAASQPFTVTVPIPFEATASSENDTVWGQIGQLEYQPVEVALFGGPVRLARTSSGNFGVDFPDVQRGAVGELRYRTALEYATVAFRRSFYTRDVVLNVHSRDDWVEGLFEAGYPVVIEVRDAANNVKATAQVETVYPPWFDGLSGFTTQLGDPWVPARPDIMPGDLVQAWIYPLEVTGEARVGTITGVVNASSDTVSGTITASWLVGPLQAACTVLEDMAPEVGFQVDPNGGAYLCDFGGAWDLQPGHQVLVRYWEPDLHSIMNQFPDPASQPHLGVDKHGDGAPTPGGNFEYVISFWNEGGGAALNTVLTDTLPVGTTYITSTLGIAPTVSARTVAFDVGTLDPGITDFLLFVRIPITTTLTLTNTVEIAASNVLTATLPPPAGWVAPIEANSTDLTVVASPSDPEPMPGSDLMWDLEVCNVGTTSSASVVITDTLPAGNVALGWWADQSGWTESAMTSGQLVAERPTASGDRCLQLHLATELSPNAIPGQQLCNLVVVYASNEIGPLNNSHEACFTVGGVAPGIAIEKSTNGQDADEPPGPYVFAGDPVQWVYEVVNTGNVTLTEVIVEDDQPGVIPGCPGTTLAPGAAMICVASGVAVDGQYANVGTVTATPQVGGDPVTAADPSHYFGEPAGLPFEDGFESGDTSAWSRTFP